jgi:hypothetical protein
MRNFPEVLRVSSDKAAETIRISQPVIVTGGLRDWPALSRWSFERMHREYGNWVVPVSVFWRGALTPERQYRRLSEVIPRIFPLPSWPLHYIQQVALADWPQGLSEEIGQPPGLSPSISTDVYLWCGPHGGSSPLHYDTRENLHALLRGYKRFLLYPPEQTPRMYSRLRPSERHLSRVNVEQVDWLSFPNFRDVQGFRCVLAPGEVLYLPKDWWHQVRLWTASISVNFWWE